MIIHQEMPNIKSKVSIWICSFHIVDVGCSGDNRDSPQYDCQQKEVVAYFVSSPNASTCDTTVMLPILNTNVTFFTMFKDTGLLLWSVDVLWTVHTVNRFLAYLANYAWIYDPSRNPCNIQIY